MRASEPNRRELRGPAGRRSGVGLRLVSLIALLALVLAAMQSLSRPEAADRLGRIFGLNRAAGNGSAAQVEIPRAGSGAVDDDAKAGVSLVHPKIDWDAIEDNAPFLASEDESWYGLIAAVSNLSLAELKSRSLGEVAYAQLRAQPDAYRGRIVTLRGTVRQVARKPLRENSLDLPALYQLWIAPRGGGEWPLVAYVQELPDGFPTAGDTIRAPVTIDAAFFKNWSYSYGDGIGVAPVLVARTFAWKPPPPASKPVATSEPPAPFWLLAVAAVGVAAAWVAWAMRRTRRAPRSPLAPALPDARTIEAIDVRAELAQLADKDAPG